MEKTEFIMDTFYSFLETFSLLFLGFLIYITFTLIFLDRDNLRFDKGVVYQIKFRRQSLKAITYNPKSKHLNVYLFDLKNK